MCHKVFFDQTSQLRLFPVRDRLVRSGKVGGGAGLHLNEDDCVAIPADKVNFTPAGSAVTFEDFPTLISEIGSRKVLTFPAQRLCVHCGVTARFRTGAKVRRWIGEGPNSRSA